MGEPDLAPLSLLWDQHLRAEFPASLRGREVDGEDLVLLDTYVAGCVSSFLARMALDEKRQAILIDCLMALEKVLPVIGDTDNGTAYYQRLQEMAELTVELVNSFDLVSRVGRAGEA